MGQNIEWSLAEESIRRAILYRPKNWTNYLVLADLLEETGREWEAKAFRWMAKNKRCPGRNGTNRQHPWFWATEKWLAYTHSHSVPKTIFYFLIHHGPQRKLTRRYQTRGDAELALAAALARLEETNGAS